MSIEMERLIVSLEARTRAFENALRSANANAQKNLKGIEQKFVQTNKRVESSMAGMSRSMAAGIGGALAAREVTRYADAWTEAGNKIAAASQTSNRQARSLGELNDIAEKTRSGITETVDLYAKLLRSTKDVAKSEEEVALATEIVNKSFKAGGAATSEQIAGILQLSQALGSGILQGDELRSLRENAPLLAQAIAAEFGTTIAGLKALGAEGKLTTDRIFKAILNSRGGIDRAFNTTTATIGDGFTQLNNVLIETAGRIDTVTGLSGKMGGGLAQVATVVENLASVFEKMSGSPIGGFVNKINELLNELNPLMQGLRVLSDEKAMDKIGDMLSPAKLDKQKKALTELNGQFEVFRGGLKALKPDAIKAFDDLQKGLNDSSILAKDAKVIIDDIIGGDPRLGEIKRKFDPLLEMLEEVEVAAKAAVVAVTKVAEGGRAGGFAFLSEKERSTKFFDERNADARRTELQKQIDTRADAILEAATKIGVSMTDAAAKIQAESELAAEKVASNAASAFDLVKSFEGFRANAYFDKTAYRAGYGSDTTTDASGKVTAITSQSVVTLADSIRDLERRIGEFQDGIKSDIGADRFSSFTEEQQAVLTSIAYNYGSLPDRIINAIKGGSETDVYNAIKGLGGDNAGINRDRRNSEAEMFISGAPAGIKKGIESQEDFAKRLEEQKQYIAALQAETGIRATLNPLVDDYGLKMSAVQAAQELLTAAQEQGTAAGLELKDVQQLLYGNLSMLTPAAQAQAVAMRELANQTGVAEAAGERLAESQAKVAESLSQSAAFGKDVLGGIIRDLREGKTAAEALSGALDKVADRLLDMALNSLFDGSKAGSGGGVLGGLFKFLFAKNGGVFAGGRSQPLPMMAKGGVANGPAIISEYGQAEAAVPLPDGRRIPVDLRMPGRSGGEETINVILQDDSGRMAEIADQRIQTASGTIVRVSVQQSTKAVERQMPGYMAKAQARSL